MGIKAQALDKALTVIAGLFAEQSGIKVVRGDKACTDGKKIILPHHRNELWLSEADIITNLGYLFHETGHVLHTDFTKDYFDERTPVRKMVTNLLEDIRIERKLSESFHIVRRYLDKLTRILAEKKGFYDEVREDSPKPALFQAYMLYKLRAEILGQKALDPLAKSTEEVCAKVFPPTMLLKLDVLMRRVLKCKSTEDVAKLAEEILKMLDEEQQQEEQPPDQQKQQQQQQSEQGGDSSGQGQSQDDQTQDGQSEDGQSQGGLSQNSQSQDGQSQSGQSQGGQSPAGHGCSGSAGSSIREVMEMAEKDVKAGIGEALAQQANTIAQANHKQHSTPMQFPDVCPHHLDGGMMSLEGIRASSNALRNRMLQWQSQVQDADVYHANSGMSFDVKRLWKRRFGSPVFMREEEGLDLQAAISIVVDRSGSMSHEIKMAIEATVATALAFDHPSIQHQVIAFPWRSRGGNPGVSVIKDWNEGVRKLASRIPRMDADGYTPMAEAILYSAAQLAGREEVRKLMLLVTDGQPDCAEAAMESIRVARQHGIHVIGLGIKVDPSGVFGQQHSATIHKMSDLAPAMIGLVRNVFVETRQ